jgi:TonB family protein
MHRVPVGSAAELQGFLTALDEDKHLAMDFWGVMGKMSEEGPAYLAGRTLNARMLEVVVEVVTGSTVAEILASGERPRQVVAQLVRLLAGEDIHSPVVVDGAPEVEAVPLDVESKKPVRPESVAAASQPRFSRSGMGEGERLPVEMRPLKRMEEEVPIAGVGEIVIEDEHGPATAQRAANREGGRGPIRWPHEPTGAETLLRQQPIVPLREVTRAGGPQSLAPARAAFTYDALPGLNTPAANEEEEIERLRLVHWLLENYPSAQGGATVRAEADYYGAKLTAAEIFAKYEEYRAREKQASVLERGIVERPESNSRVAERITEADRTEVAKTEFWRSPEKAVDLEETVPEEAVDSTEASPYTPLPDRPLPQKSVVLQTKTQAVLGKMKVLVMEGIDDPSIRAPLSNFEEDDEDSIRQRKVFLWVLSGIVAVGIVVGLLMAQVHLAQWWRNMEIAFNKDISSFSNENRATLDIPNERVLDPEPKPVEPAPVRRAAPQSQKRSATPAPAPVPAARTGLSDRPLVRILPAQNDRIDPAASQDAARVGGPVTVAAGVMESYLISAQPPSYPEGVKAGEAGTRVVLQATIGKNGTVGHLRVLSGDQLLRGAAAEAVAKWRYRPYTLNNEPVEVSTTVVVDFSRGQ